jgi:hypothetical protein
MPSAPSPKRGYVFSSLNSVTSHGTDFTFTAVSSLLSSVFVTACRVLCESRLLGGAAARYVTSQADFPYYRST